jgi:sugar diacid utilization regulator/putative methionine-R-sulfoxide reductase with GAF domain
MQVTHESTALRDLLGTVPDSMLAAAAEIAAALAIDHRVSILTCRDGHWTALAGDDGLCAEHELRALGSVPLQGNRQVVTVGEVAIVLAKRAAGHADVDATLMRQACAWLAMASKIAVSQNQAHAAVEEAEVLRVVAGQILTVRDLDQVLLSITNHTLPMLESDICGVFLREGDEVRMRSCAGHRVVETARLRMRPGQGVAGMVFETGEVGKVDSYLEDRTISTDFMSLAEQEAAHSALAVPLRAHGELIGVLEVWRRRHSIFTERDVRRLVSLAHLVTIAIENARLYGEQRATVGELQRAHDNLAHQVSLLHRSSALQQSLIQVVLEGSSATAAIARSVGVELDCQVAVLSAEGQIEAVHPRDFDAAELAQRASRWSKGSNTRSVRRSERGQRVWAHPVHAGDNQFGVVCLVGGTETDEIMEVACGQAAMACSLAQMEQRAASYARAEAFEQILWDLLHGPPEHRLAARSRAQQMGVRLKGPHRIIYGVFDNLGDLARLEGWDSSTCDRVRRDALRALQDCPDAAHLLLPNLRGDWIVAVAAAEQRAEARELVQSLSAIARGLNPPLKMSWGVSTIRDDPFDYPAAFSEANTALSAARRLGADSVALYDELGIVRLLLGSEQDPDYQAFIREVTGPLMDYDEQHEGALMRTLRTFFDADCSQKSAAERLFVHPKTLSYRLERIKELTGLDLARHADRMRADLALRLVEVTGPGVDGDTIA